MERDASYYDRDLAILILGAFLKFFIDLRRSSRRRDYEADEAAASDVRLARASTSSRQALGPYPTASCGGTC